MNARDDVLGWSLIVLIASAAWLFAEIVYLLTQVIE